MVQFWLNGAPLAVVENPCWVRMQSNGYYGICDRDIADCVIIDGTTYNLPGHNISENATVYPEEIDTGTYITQKNEQMLTDLDLANIEVQQAITDLELMILGG